MEKHPEPERKFLVRSFSDESLTSKGAIWRKTTFLPSGNKAQVVRIRAEIAWPHFSIASEIELTPDPPRTPRENWHAFHDIKERNSEGDWQSQTEETKKLSPRNAWTIFDQLACPWITKVRYRIPHGEQVIELDIFTKPELRGLVIAEVELRSPEEKVSLPSWVHESVEVTEDARFQNVNLANITSLDELNLQEVWFGDERYRN